METHDREQDWVVPDVAPLMVSGAGGVRVAAYEWGNPDGKELFLIHGVAQCHLCFAPQIASELAREFRIVAVDLRGHGAADKPLDVAAYRHHSAWADDIAAVIQAKGLRRPVAVGWSMGGRVLRQYLMRYGDGALGGVNFVGSRVIEDPRAVGPATPTGQPFEELTVAQEVAHTISFLAACYYKQPARTLFERALCYNATVPMPVRRAAAGWHTDPQETIAALRKVRVPVLISQGMRDTIVLPEAARMTAEAIPHARISWYDECGHSPFQEYPERFNQELADFARGV
ncbi:MAG TPA: alpha/beta hydrolase [Bordetella sp.]|nr:alpha/beta hydrolase [Bordetella sp.]